MFSFTCGVCLQEQAVDMVLTDYCMPEMTGYDLLKAIKVYLFLFLKKKRKRYTYFFFFHICVVSHYSGW